MKEFGEAMSDTDADLACAWADYRKAFGVPAEHLTAAHKAFKAGWEARANPTINEDVQR